ncbi:PDZ domain-containing protein [bacterium]|nr:PDZ domain-containing protein [bacterium]
MMLLVCGHAYAYWQMYYDEEACRQFDRDMEAGGQFDRPDYGRPQGHWATREEALAYLRGAGLNAYCLQHIRLIERVEASTAARGSGSSGGTSNPGGQRGGRGGGQLVSLGAVLVETPTDATTKGLLAQQVVPGGLADAVGLKPGDVIVKWGMMTLAELPNVARKRVLPVLTRGTLPAGLSVDIVVARDGQTINLTINTSNPGAQPAGGGDGSGGPGGAVTPGVAATPADSPTGRQRFSLGVGEAPSESPTGGPHFSLGFGGGGTPPDSPANGILVQRVVPGGIADAAGIMPGDVIVKWGSETFSASPDNIGRVLPLSAEEDGLSADIVVVRNGQTIPLTVRCADPAAQSANSVVTPSAARQLVVSAALAQQAADAAVGGNLEAARDLAQKSARAMTGEIDLTQLPSLGDLSKPGDSTPSAALSTEALSAVDENLRRMDSARVAQERVPTPCASPEQAALRMHASLEEARAVANLLKLSEVLATARRDPSTTNEAVVAIRSLGKVTAVSGPVATPGGAGGLGGQTTPAGPQPAVKDDITPEQRRKLLAELTSLQGELEATKAQLGKLTGAIQQDQRQFEDWELVARAGMDKCSGVLYNLLMDWTVAPLSERCEVMHGLAQKLPDKPQGLIDRLGRISAWFKAMGATQTLKDVADVAGREGKTRTELLEEVRDDLSIIASQPGFDKFVVSVAWKQGINMVDMAWSYAQFSAAYDGIEQMTKNSEGYRQAVAALTTRMQAIVKRTHEVKQELSGE